MVQTSSPFLQALDLHLHGAWDLPLKKRNRGTGDKERQSLGKM